MKSTGKRGPLTLVAGILVVEYANNAGVFRARNACILHGGAFSGARRHRLLKYFFRRAVGEVDRLVLYWVHVHDLRNHQAFRRQCTQILSFFKKWHRLVGDGHAQGISDGDSRGCNT